VLAGVPTVLKQPFDPQVTSNVSVGLVSEWPVISKAATMELDSPLDIAPVYVCPAGFLLRLRWCVQCRVNVTAAAETVTVID